MQNANFPDREDVGLKNLLAPVNNLPPKVPGCQYQLNYILLFCRYLSITYLLVQVKIEDYQFIIKRLNIC
jgi:hypothetical protein